MLSLLFGNNSHLLCLFVSQPTQALHGSVIPCKLTMLCSNLSLVHPASFAAKFALTRPCFSFIFSNSPTSPGMTKGFLKHVIYCRGTERRRKRKTGWSDSTICSRWALISIIHREPSSCSSLIPICRAETPPAEKKKLFSALVPLCYRFHITYFSFKYKSSFNALRLII